MLDDIVEGILEALFDFLVVRAAIVLGTIGVVFYVVSALRESTTAEEEWRVACTVQCGCYSTDGGTR